MPRIRLTYAKDIEREGTDTLEVDEHRAQALVNLRRAVVLDEPVALVDELSRPQLLERAAQLGVEVPSSATKPQIAAAISAAEAAPAAPAG